MLISSPGEALTEAGITKDEIAAGRDITAAELGDTPREYQELVVGLLKGHAQGEAFVLDREIFAHWAADAPRAEDRFMVLTTIKEELEHALEAWRLLRQLSDLIDWTDLSPLQPGGSRYEGFRHPTTDWAEFAALSALTDRVGCFQQEEQIDCSYLPYQEAVQKVYFPLEKGHAARGRYWLRELCKTDDGLGRAQAAVDVWWPRALDMFGRSESTRQNLYIQYRLKKRTNEERRQAYIATVGPELDSYGLTVPDNALGRQFL
ncbi:MAG: Phenylacetic acid catabolic protein [Acidimicrobiales bacterium]